MKKALFMSSIAATILLFAACGDSGSSNASNKGNQGSSSSVAEKVVQKYASLIGQEYDMNTFNIPLGSTTFSNGFELNATWGIGSGAFHDSNDSENIVYFMSDRGVNIKCKDTKDIIGEKLCDDGKVFPFVDFTPSIIKAQITGNKIKILNVIDIKDSNATAITGIVNPISNVSENAYDSNGSTLSKDIDGIDSEALVKLSDGTFYIAEEYGPSLLHVNAEGIVLTRLVPKGMENEFSNATYPVYGVLPDILKKRHKNRGFESLAVSEDGTYLYAMTQSALDNPDESTSQSSRNIRLFKFRRYVHDSIEKVVLDTTYWYKLDTPDTFIKDNNAKSREQKDVKISEMVSVGNNTLLVVERISDTTKIYKVDLSNEISVKNDWNRVNKTPTFEEVSGNELTIESILPPVDANTRPVTKTEVFNTDNETGFVKKIEGVAHLGGNKFLLINDNDFGIEGDSTVAKIVEINY